MIRIYFDTSNYISKDSKTHSLKVINAQILALNGVGYEYEKLTGPLINRLKFMLSLPSTLDSNSEGNKVTIKYDYQGTEIKKRVPAQIPNMSFIENSSDEIRMMANAVMKEGVVRVPFSRYLDFINATDLEGAYLVIERIK